MAHEEFLKQAGNDDGIIFCVKEEVEKFKRILIESSDVEQNIIIIKNIELFSNDIFDLVSTRQKLIISGDVNKAIFKEKILAKKYLTNILFSSLGNMDVPDLEKYEGFVMSETLQGKTTLHN